MSAPDVAPQMAVEMRRISKRFGPVEALDTVDLQVAKGEIHAVVGENGAGKTTLMRILYGALRLDSGEIFVEGKKASFSNAADGIAAGIGMVTQHYSIIPELTCLQNLMLGAEPSFVIDKEAASARAQALAESMGFQFDWNEKALHLSPAGAQKLEILKLLWRNARIMILDEPTAMLSPTDSDALFESLTKLANSGATIILVTHRLPEVLEHCQKVTVLRGGRKVTEKVVAQTSGSELAELIVGHAMQSSQPIAPKSKGESVLNVQNLQAKGRRGDTALKGVSLELRKGEVLGIAGVDGSGQRELFWALTGALALQKGSIHLRGKDVSSATPRERIELGLRLIPEDRHEEGVVEEWPLEWNVAIGLQRLPQLSSNGWIKRDARRGLAAVVAERFQTKHGGVDHPISSLSGGNQQRFIAARALQIDADVLLAFQPARGLDIEATRQVYKAIRENCAAGAAALIVSFDLDEILEHCDRVLVLCGGKMYEPPPGQERDRAAIGRLMVAA